MSQKPTPEETTNWQRRLASQANNRAWSLSESLVRTPEEDDEMLQDSSAKRRSRGRLPWHMRWPPTWLRPTRMPRRTASITGKRLPWLPPSLTLRTARFWKQR
jgi:hypothetical protein